MIYLQVILLVHHVAVGVTPCHSGSVWNNWTLGCVSISFSFAHSLQNRLCFVVVVVLLFLYLLVCRYAIAVSNNTVNITAEFPYIRFVP